MIKKTYCKACIALCLTLVFTLGFAQDEKTIYGVVETVTLLPEQLTLNAKLDTGAENASLHAVNIQEIQRDGETWVRFDTPIPDGHEVITFEKPLIRYAYIKAKPTVGSLQQEPGRRPVVSMTVCLANQAKTIDVNLANRERFTYPMLLGANSIIAFDGIIDPSETFTQPPRCQ